MHKDEFDKALNAIHARVATGAAELSQEKRQAIFDGSGVPEDAQAFVDKVHRHAYKVTDEDVDALKASGYSEDAIYEATICAALGAGMARWQAAMAALPDEKV